MRDFHDLQVWQKSHQLTLAVYQVTENFPKTELYGLTSQIRRSAASVPTNIAEGAGRDTDREMVRFLSIASGSASELEYQLLLAHDLAYLPKTDYHNLRQQVVSIKRMLYRFHLSLTTQSTNVSASSDTQNPIPDTQL
jgi:four helix bundle protein